VVATGREYIRTTLAPALKNDAEHNMMRALEAWVEKGVAPEKIIGGQIRRR